MQKLQRDSAPEFEILGLVNDTDPATSETRPGVDKQPVATQQQLWAYRIALIASLILAAVFAILWLQKP